MPSVMNHRFSEVPSVEIPRSRFDRTHGYKTTFDSGYLIPFYVDEALPGDTFDLKHSIFTRMTTPIVPVMDNVFMETFYFAVPVRLLWENFQKFMGEQKFPGEITDFLVPQVRPAMSTGFEVGSLSDYFGLPVNVPGIKVSALWHRAYNLIWNEWFRDENLQEPAIFRTDDAERPDSNFPVLRRGKRHDYFTSALPWPQKGPGVELPLTGDAPVFSPRGSCWRFESGTHDYGPGYFQYRSSATSYNIDVSSGGRVARLDSAADPYKTETDVNVYPEGWYADLSSVTGATINSLRQAFQLQRLLERDARGGTRYTEILRSHFGVVSPDARLQRPEYLGGSSTRIHFTPVQQTGATDDISPQGNLAAYVTGADTGTGFSKSFVEHSVIIGLVSIRADLTYQDGINRMFSRRTRYDYYWPALAHLGEQAILNKEIYAQGTAEDEAVFGYQERWAEYRYKPSTITGKMRSKVPGSLDIWHLSEYFDQLPLLGDEFIEDNPPIKRILAVQSEPEFLLDAFIDLKCTRPMPVYSVPGLIDHF